MKSGTRALWVRGLVMSMGLTGVMMAGCEGGEGEGGLEADDMAQALAGTTRLVDDDKDQCPAAKYTTIKAAIAAWFVRLPGPLGRRQDRRDQEHLEEQPRRLLASRGAVPENLSPLTDRG